MDSIKLSTVESPMVDNAISTVIEKDILGKKFTIYGTPDEPLFLAKDVAEMIEYDLSSVNKMIANVDEDEKTTRKIVPIGSNYQTEAWFLTENGLYEVLMQSRKPIAKDFKKGVVKALSDMRKTADNRLRIGETVNQELITQNNNMKLKIFSNENFGKVRVTEVNGEPMFCLVDVARALEYARPADAVSDHCKGVVILPTPTNGGVQQIKFGKEAEVYRLIMKSKAQRAEEFQDWVCEEVLPTIRRTGQYGGFVVPKTFKEALLLAVQQQEVIEQQHAELEIARPKAEYFDAIVERNLLTNFRDTAKELHMKQNEFISKLVNGGFIYRDTKNQIKPIAQYVNDGWFEIKEYKSGGHAGNQTLLTPKGREAFRQLFIA